MDNNIYSFIGLIHKAGKLSSGDDTVEISIKKDKSKFLIIAEDSSENTKKRFVNSAKFHKLPFVYFGSKADLGASLGKSERSILSINDDGFAVAFRKKIEESGGVGIVKD